MSEYWTLQEVAEYLQVTRTTMHRLLRKGKIPGAFRIGRIWRFKADVITNLGKVKE